MDITKITTSPPNPVTVNNEVPSKGKNPFWTARRVQNIKMCCYTVLAVCAITSAVAFPLIFFGGVGVLSACLIGASAGIGTAVLAGLGIYFGRNLGQLTINPTNTPYRRIAEEKAKQKPEPIINHIDIRSRWMHSLPKKDKAKDPTNPPYRTIIEEVEEEEKAADEVATAATTTAKAIAEEEAIAFAQIAAAEKAAADKVEVAIGCMLLNQYEQHEMNSMGNTPETSAFSGTPLTPSSLGTRTQSTPQDDTRTATPEQPKTDNTVQRSKKIRNSGKLRTSLIRKKSNEGKAADSRWFAMTGRNVEASTK